jgi:hypothetical protein
MKISNQADGTKPANWTAQIEEMFSRPLILGLLLAVVTIAVYWPARKFDFLGYDDPLYFTQNAHVLIGLLEQRRLGVHQRRGGQLAVTWLSDAGRRFSATSPPGRTWSICCSTPPTQFCFSFCFTG